VTCKDHHTGKETTVVLDGISIEDRKKIAANRYHTDESRWLNQASPVFTLYPTKNYGILTVSRSFFDPKIDPDYDSTLKQAFTVLKAKKITNLIIDLRNNEGGSEHQQAELMSYLYSKPFKLYENIYVSRLDYRPLKPVLHTAEKDTSRLLDTNEDEWMRKIKDDLWINNYEYYEGLQLQAPKKEVFKGKVYVLINGGSFSSTSALIANIKNTIPAKFIGEESGGTYEGPTGGQTIPIILPNSKIMVRISPNINISYLYQKHPVGRGVIPDYPIHYSIHDVLAGKDLEMEFAKKLITRERAR
jgi:C-terminal processing protease CtpA/Prc